MGECANIRMINLFLNQNIKVHKLVRDAKGQETLAFFNLIAGYFENKETSTIDKYGTRVSCDGAVFVKELNLPYPDFVFEIEGEYFIPMSMEKFNVLLPHSRFKVQKSGDKWD